MMALLLLAQPSGGGQVGQLARTFGVDWPHFLAQCVSFAIVCALLYRFAYRPVLAVLEERRRQIKAELARMEAQRQEVLAQAHAESARLIEEARAAAARLHEEETRKATAAAGQIVARAREDAAREHTRMLAELKGQVGRLVVQTTAAVTGKVLTQDDQRRLAEETARRLAP
jgi:F-type H+-transporting ATPase subunit b